MLEAGLVPGVTIRFPDILRFEVGGTKKIVECSDRVEDIPITLQNGDYSVVQSVKFIPYAPGGVNYAETNADVLSGFFTGCVMTIYTRDGVRRVGHVHTGAAYGPVDCRDFMRGLLRNPFSTYREISSFKPYENINAQLFLDIAGRAPQFFGGGCRVFGLVSSTNRCFSVFTRSIGTHEYLVEKCIDNTVRPYIAILCRLCNF